MRQPISTITNAAYLIPAILAPTPLSSLAFVLLAVGSGLFHGLPTDEDWPRYADEIGMYSAFWSLIGLSLDPYVAAAGFGMCAVKFKHFDSFQSIPILFITALAAKVHRAGYEALYVLIPFGVALLFTYIGYQYEEDTKLHDVAHGLWHISSSIGFTLFLTI